MMFADTSWNRPFAKDPGVVEYRGELLLYFSTRDPDMRIQMTGVATAPLDSDFSRAIWQQWCDAPILYPEIPWEQECIGST